MGYLPLEALVEEAEWTASGQDRVAALSELPLDLYLFLLFLDAKVDDRSEAEFLDSLR